MSNFDLNKNWYVCSLVVQAKPAKLEQVQADILNIPHSEIHTIESDRQLALADRIDEVKEIDGVIVVSLISNYLDEK